jgi:DNA-binding CsgD family transcriptional regulator
MLTKTEQVAISLLTASHTQKDIADKLNKAEKPKLKNKSQHSPKLL